jgi:hypothetical protein
MSHGMIPIAWSVALTAVFVVSGLYCLWRVAAGRGRGMDLVVDVNHVLMSPAMLLMVWWPSVTGSTWVQLVAFSGLALVFFRDMSRAHEVSARTAALLHGGMNLGMVWMLAVGMSSMSGMPDMAEMAGMDMDHTGHLTGAEAWGALLSWPIAGLLALSAGWWFVRAVRVPGHRILCCCHGMAAGGMAAMVALMTPAL